MRKTTLYAQTSALPAIAAVLALISTPSFAQVTPPSTTDPTVAAQPAPTPPATDAMPVAAEPATTASSTATSTTAGPSVTTTTHSRTVPKARAAAPKTVSKATRTTVTRHAAAPVQTSMTSMTRNPVSPTTATAPVVAPAVVPTPKPTPQPAASAKPARTTDETLPIAGGALALLALGGAAYGLSRRRRHEDEWVEEDAFEAPAMEQEPAVATATDFQPRHDPIVHDEQPETVAPSAFAWSTTAPTQEHASRDSGDDRLPGETWVQRAYRGPSANNPSVSLKNRLRRAAFFDKRERDVAAGLAEPVEPDAGLPHAMAEEQERELA